MEDKSLPVKKPYQPKGDVNAKWSLIWLGVFLFGLLIYIFTGLLGLTPSLALVGCLGLLMMPIGLIGFIIAGFLYLSDRFESSRDQRRFERDQSRRIAQAEEERRRRTATPGTQEYADAHPIRHWSEITAFNSEDMRHKAYAEAIYDKGWSIVESHLKQSSDAQSWEGWKLQESHSGQCKVGSYRLEGRRHSRYLRQKSIEIDHYSSHLDVYREDKKVFSATRQSQREYDPSRSPMNSTAEIFSPSLTPGPWIDEFLSLPHYLD